LGWKNREVTSGVDRYRIFQHIWELAESGQIKLYTSAITFAEVYKLRHQTQTQPLATIMDLLGDFEKEFVESIEVDREIGLTANLLCRTYAAQKLYPNDAIHLACALRAKCDVLLAWDRPLNSIVHRDIRIEEPSIIGQMKMLELASPREGTE
jgi:predicted nucleic acid-binding protein